MAAPTIIKTERRQAKAFAFRAEMLDELKSPVAPLFRELAELCDRKIEVIQLLDRNHKKMSRMLKTKPPH